VTYPKLTLARLEPRDGSRRCWHCWEDVAVGVQHRSAKGMGGRADAESPANGISLCNALNVAVEQDSAVAAWAEAHGWKVGRWTDPATVPVLDAVTGYWWQLHDDGSKTRVA